MFFLHTAPEPQKGDGKIPIKTQEKISLSRSITITITGAKTHASLPCLTDLESKRAKDSCEP